MPIKFPVFLLLIAALTSATPVSLNSGISTSDPKTRNTALRQKYADAIEAIFGIGIRSTALLADPSNTGNIIVSPVSITLLIGQLMLGAKGPFLDQLYNLLSLTKARYNENAWYIKGQDRVYPLPHARLHIHLKSLILELASRERNFTLHESNALFYDSDLQLDGNFQHYLKVFYDTLLQPLDFDHDPEASVNLMNKWASNHTNGLIRNILPSPPSQPNAAIFANALYFRAEWETPFSDELNRPGPFFVTPDKTVQVTYMLGFLEDIKYAETPEYKIVSLPYRNNELAMYILLPTEKNPDIFNIRAFQQRLTASEILATIAGAKSHSVTIKMPKMQLSSTVSILNPMKKYLAYKKQTNKGVQANDTRVATDQLNNLVQDFIKFNTSDDERLLLSGAAANANLEITDIVQQLTLSVNEKGTEAAAVSAGILDYIGGSKGLLVERPFVFFIMQPETQVVLFWGSISNPTQGGS